MTKHPDPYAAWRKSTPEETAEIQDAVTAGRLCVCCAVDANGSPLNLTCPMHPHLAPYIHEHADGP